MPEPDQATRVIRFGVFEVDLHTTELRKQGVRVRLPLQSFQVLEALLRRPGELVTRKELKEKLWPSDSFGDFEHGLNAAVNRVRDALGDSSDNPRFVETIPRRGYRFLVPVNGAPQSTAAGVLEDGEAGKKVPSPKSESFQNAGTKTDTEYLSDGVTTSMSNNLTATATPAWSSVVHMKSVQYGLAVAILTVVAINIAVFLTPAPVSGPLDSTQITFSGEPKGGPLLTDGSRLYFQSSGVPSEMAVSGGIITPMPHLEPGMLLVDISADGSKLLEWKQLDTDTGRGSLWVAGSQGGAPRRLGHYLVNAATWSPDGESIVFSDLRTLYAINADGGNLRKIWEGPGFLGGVCFSPDARELTVTALIFTGKENQRPRWISQLWRVKANGESAHPVLTDWPARTWSPRWTPDGRHFVFTSDREGLANVYELVAPRWFEFWKKPAPVRITGNQVPILSSTPARDSKSLFVLGRMNVGAMQVVDPRTQKLLPFLGGLSALEFVVSPDRRWMAYTDYPTGYLWKSKLDGSERLQLTNSPAFMEQWSPDGKSLVYSDWRKLYLVSADGRSLEQLISTGDNEVMPTWFADGKSIAFCYNNFMDQPPDGLYTLDLATRKVSRMPDSKGFFIPSWSPDGNFLVAIAQNPWRMMLYSAETKSWSVLTQLQALWGYWTWSSDSKSLYMGILQSGIYRLFVPDGKWEKVTGLEGVDAREPNAFVSLTADGQPAIMTHVGDAQIYSLHWTN